MSLFDSSPPAEPQREDGKRPLAERMRPTRLEDYIGQEHILGPDKPLRRQIERDQLTSIILWGPPGVGKTTLAKLIARLTRCEYIPFSAVLSGIKEIKAVMADAERLRRMGRRTILFIDEIHRFNKAQQDAFLPYVERGDIILIGATTENPSFEVISALLSRSRVYALRGLTVPEIVTLLKRALPEVSLEASDDLLEQIAIYSNGDARQAYNTLEAAAAASGGTALTEASVQDAMQRKLLLYDKGGEEHFNLISALHKSVRSSDTDAALYWLTRMLEAGEDRLYIARRLIRMASEDIGLADPRALEQTVAAMQAVHFLGIPEGGDIFVRRAEVRRGVSCHGRRSCGRGEHHRRAGADEFAQRTHAPDEGVGLLGRLPARPQVRRCRRRHGVPAAIARRAAILFPDGSRSGEAN
jgi:putative ATPase